jgi:hypothetical protein
MRLDPRSSGRATVSVQGRGSDLALPFPLTVTPPVTVQLQSEAGECWEATYATPQKRPNVYQAHGID